jgi:putative transposase
MNASVPPNAYQPDRVPAELIRHGGWLYERCCLRDRDVEERRFARGVIVPYEAIGTGCRTCGQAEANQRRRRRPRPGAQGHREEVFRTSKGARHDRWRAVAQDGTGRARLVPWRRDQPAATRCFRTRLNGCHEGPRVIMTDPLQSYGAATREMRPGVEPRPQRSLQNRAAHSPQPTRQRERRRPGCTSPGHAPRFLAASGRIAHHVRPRRHRLPAPVYRHVRAQRFQIGYEGTGTTAA